MSQRSVSAVMSVPRLGFMDNFMCAQAALVPLGIEVSKATGVFWGQCLTRIFEQVIATYDPKWILTIDYDTVFTLEDVQALLRLVEAYPEIDALCPLQIHRTENRPLLTVPPAGDGKGVQCVDITTFWRDLTRIQTGHMGLTLIRAEALGKIEKPWFHSTPDSNGGWGPGHEDDDTHFWMRWWNAGNTLYQANRVPVGHLELMIRWPDGNMAATHQHPNEFWKAGKPANVWK